MCLASLGRVWAMVQGQGETLALTPKMVYSLSHSPQSNSKCDLDQF